MQAQRLHLATLGYHSLKEEQLKLALYLDDHHLFHILAMATIQGHFTSNCAAAI